MKRAAVLLIIALAAPAHAEPSFDAHMLAGAKYFQEGRYTDALVEFRVAERLAGDGGPIWYVAAALVKLKRPEDAITEFARAEVRAAADRDGLFDYYHALACYDARLYSCADRLLATIGDEPGPKIAEQARKIRRDLAPVLTVPAPPSTIDWYHARGQAALRAGREVLAVAYFEEAVGLAGPQPDAYRRAEALTALAHARTASLPESKR